MKTRQPIVAGQFYPAGRDACLAEVRHCLDAAVLPASLPESIVAGIVPHAGWTFSGPTAALVFAAVKKRHERVDTFVLCGAAHGYVGSTPAVDDSDRWESPLGDIQIDGALRELLLQTNAAKANASAHRTEHSLEVQVPFIQHLFDAAKILPIVVPPTEAALALGEALADIMSRAPQRIVCIGSTDLTHYGPRYGFTPMGAGAEGLRWASAVNDQQFIELALRLDADRLLSDALERGNACGPGAAAAAIRVAETLGVTRGSLLAHTDSNEVMVRQMGAAGRDSVGYAALVF
jgi:AmmeMemoRadiSam system protein B